MSYRHRFIRRGQTPDYIYRLDAQTYLDSPDRQSLSLRFINMDYVSTRQDQESFSFAHVTLSGLANDGGLYMPRVYPNVSSSLTASADNDYLETAFLCLNAFTSETFDEKTLRAIIKRSYSVFSSPQITPLRRLKDQCLLELFHGPTFAFKDVALQFLGNVFEFFLRESNDSLCLLGATSGDTGSAAIHGVKGKKNIRIFMLHPKNRISKIQEWQMTGVLDDNVYNVAIDGSFDDCQNIVKELFGNAEFRTEMNLGAVNSINIARILAQAVYYFQAYFEYARLFPGTEKVTFCVPTGNFGNVFAGYLARQMGLPMNRLVVATNENDMLERVIREGRYQIRRKTVPTISPSMDVQISSNFERFLFDASDRNADRINELMRELRETGNFVLNAQELKATQEQFEGISVSEDETRAAIRRVYQSDEYILDPHTAVACAAIRKRQTPNDEPVICLGTAHPAKFGDTVTETLNIDLPLPTTLRQLRQLPKRVTELPADSISVKRFISQNNG